MDNIVNGNNDAMWFIIVFYSVLFIVIGLIMLQIKFINYNDNLRKNDVDEDLSNITKHYLNIGLTLNEAKVMTTIFKQLKLEYINLNNDNDIDNYIIRKYPQNFYNKKLYKNIIKNTLKTD